MPILLFIYQIRETDQTMLPQSMAAAAPVIPHNGIITIKRMTEITVLKITRFL